MGEIIRGMFYSTEETTESDKTRFTFVRTLVFLLVAVFASVWLLREHLRIEAATGAEWSLQLVAGMPCLLVAVFLFFYLWKQFEDNVSRQNVRKILDSL